MVTRNRQRESENEPRYRVTDLASWQDHIYFHVSIPVLVQIPEKPLPPPTQLLQKPKRPRGRPKLYHLQLEKSQQETKQELKKLKTEQYWEDILPNIEEKRQLKREVAFFNQPLNYHWGNLWAIRHSELQYDGANEPL